MRKLVFEDVDLEHRWVQEYRIPVLTTAYPHYGYEVALMVGPKGKDAEWMIKAEEPTEEEAKIIGSLIDYRRSYYYPHYQQQMLEREFDVDNFTNTIILAKLPWSWTYRRGTWTMGPLFCPVNPAVVKESGEEYYSLDAQGLVNLITDRIYPDYGSTSEDSWQYWMESHLEIFGEYK